MAYDLQQATDAIRALNRRVAALEGASAVGWTAINIQMEPHELKEADKAAGVDRAASYHDLAYLAHAEAQVSMSKPQPPMGEVIRLLGDGLILRSPINKWQFDADGNLHPDYHRMLEEWVAAGGRLQFVSAWLGNEQFPHPVRAEGAAAMRAYLRGVAGVTAEGWRAFGRWYARQSPEMQDAVLALEVFNEPAIYDRAIGDKLLSRLDVIDLFVSDQIRIAREGMYWWHGPIMAATFAYNARTAELAEPISGRTGIERLREAFGKRLMWSVHRYPGWVRERTPEAWKAALLAGLEVLKPDPIVITETNADLGAATTSFDYQAARVMGEVAAEGIGIGWFSGINFGAALISFWGQPAIRNIDRLASFWDAATINNREPSRLDQPFKVFRSRLDARGGHESRLVRIVGGPGGDIIAPTEEAATLIYGNGGDDNITINPNASTWVFGQYGNDTIDARTGPFALLVLGDGDDTVLLGADQVFVHGAGGSDRFVLGRTGSAVIDNFHPGIDVIDAGGLPVTATVDGNDTVLTSGSGTARLLSVRQIPTIL